MRDDPLLSPARFTIIAVISLVASNLILCHSFLSHSIPRRPTFPIAPGWRRDHSAGALPDRTSVFGITNLTDQFDDSDLPTDFSKLHHSSDRWFLSNGVKPSLSFERFVSEEDADGVVTITIKLPPFYWALPLGLDEEGAATFWKQPENTLHFNDSLDYVFGTVQVFTQSSLPIDFDAHNNKTHYFNYENNHIVQPCSRPTHDTVMYMSRHDTDYFQHFLDNGSPHISLMHLATGLDPGNVSFVMGMWSEPIVPYLLRRYGFKSAETASSGFCAKKLILPKMVPVLHPIFTQTTINWLRLNHAVAKLIVLVSRTEADTGKYERMIENQAALEAAMSARFGQRFVVFRPAETQGKAAIELFEKAEVVMGSHGGALYNALWANRNAKIVEILPVNRYGGYPDQGKPTDDLQWAHLAFHTNCMMNFQRYYRFYQLAYAINYEIDVGRFMNWFEKIHPRRH
jgi:hypothetical protein